MRRQQMGGGKSDVQFSRCLVVAGLLLDGCMIVAAGGLSEDEGTIATASDGANRLAAPGGRRSRRWPHTGVPGHALEMALHNAERTCAAESFYASGLCNGIRLGPGATGAP